MGRTRMNPLNNKVALIIAGVAFGSFGAPTWSWCVVIATYVLVCYGEYMQERK